MMRGFSSLLELLHEQLAEKNASSKAAISLSSPFHQIIIMENESISTEVREHYVEQVCNNVYVCQCISPYAF